MPRKRRPGRPRKHGGRREGSGRKPVGGVGTQVVAVSLTPQDIGRVERWMETHDETNFSAAVRAMLQVASAHEPT